MSLTPREKLAASILRVCEPPKGLAPYFGVMLRGLVRRETEGLGTIGVTKDGIMLWDPAFVDKIDVAELAIVLMHEVMHIVLKHHERAEHMGVVPDPSPEAHTKAALANMACDACINEELEKVAKVPMGGVLPEHLNQPAGLTFEERYRLLEQQVKKQQKKQGGHSEDGKGESEGKDQQKPGAGKGWCGSAAGRPVPQEPASKGKNDDEARSPAEMERFRKATAEAVKEFEQKGRGTVPGSLSRWADSMLQPAKVPWREKLARVVRGAVAFKSGCSDYTWGKISRRQAGVGFGVGRPVIPALHAPVPKVAVLVDTSGSMQQSDLVAAASEVQGVLAAVGANVLVATVDAALQGIKECRSMTEALSLFKGGGGTVLIHGWNALLAKKPACDVIVVITDAGIGGPGDGYPAIEPKAKVVWCIVGGAQQRPCPYGEVVIVEADGVREVA
jgi:predicted metal-dependent peptidase